MQRTLDAAGHALDVARCWRDLLVSVVEHGQRALTSPLALVTDAVAALLGVEPDPLEE